MAEPTARRFLQVNVFSGEALGGNPVAVVADAEGLSEETMRRLASWTNLSETTFLLPPTVPEADYRVRIFTPSVELPFAGHPTLGSAHAWLASGGTPTSSDGLVQECGAGLVRVVDDGGRRAFAGPPLVRYERPEPEVLARATRALGMAPDDVVDASWLVNGPEWLALRLGSAERVLSVEPDYGMLGGLDVGVVGPHPPGGEVTFEVRAFMDTGDEDPVTGSLNAGLGRWLRDSGVAPSSYVAAQGTVLGRSGRAHVSERDGEIWVAGETTTVITGTIDL
ncbi:PhzF family phenazine biosynthesis protein [Georgenia alba]|uniref:PhzF family phenazine biosynthesis protein n=1 Tax=Georgenia alba TaxID=2233858 RepID=A0ABW2Q4W3_9MICO